MGHFASLELLNSTGTVDTPSLRGRIQARPDPEQVLASPLQRHCATQPSDTVI